MKVKIGDRIYYSKDQPIAVILGPQDKENIKNMHPGATVYAEFDDSMEVEVVEAWMSETKKENKI